MAVPNVEVIYGKFNNNFKEKIKQKNDSNRAVGLEILVYAIGREHSSSSAWIAMVIR
jgi:hypothetical protein